MTDDLATRLEAGPGSRELDAEIRFLFFDDMTRCNFEEGCYHGDCEAPGCGGWLGLHDERKSYPGRWQDDERLPRYTESVDDGLALAGDEWEAILREALYRMLCAQPDRSKQQFVKLPLFICAALVRAKEQETASE